MTLFEVEVPLVARKVRREPNALAAMVCAAAITPVASFSEASAALHEVQRRHVLLGAFLIEGVELVVDDDGLEIAVLFDRGERIARRGDPGKRDADRIVERAGGGVQPLDEFLQHQRFIVDDKNPADRLFHGVARKRETGLLRETAGECKEETPIKKAD